MVLRLDTTTTNAITNAVASSTAPAPKSYTQTTRVPIISALTIVKYHLIYFYIQMLNSNERYINVLFDGKDMEKNRLRQVIADHQQIFGRKEEYLIERDVNLDYFLKGNEIVIISGIRRCGKSTLLKSISGRLPGKKLFLDFDDIRLTDFTVDNFPDVEDIAYEFLGTADVMYFFDEIQNIPGWERWVNNLYSKDRKVFLTGSNSKLLSSEISTFLTGRNKVLKLYPFSFREFLRLKGLDDADELKDVDDAGVWKNVDGHGGLKGVGDTGILTTEKRNIIFNHFNRYFEQGGFPLIDKNEDVEMSGQYFEDILNKDILARYRIKHVKEVKDLVVYLFSNAGRTYSYSTLKRITGIKSLSTLKNYVDYLKNVFLMYTIDRFDYSITKQKLSSAKPYIADNSFFKTISFNFSENRGRRLENLVFLQLLRKGKDVYYHQGKRECDFVIKEGLDVTAAIQVSYDISNPITGKREIEGLLEAMKKYKLKEGLILTMETSKRMEDKGITVKPVWEWLLQDDG